MKIYRWKCENVVGGLIIQICQYSFDILLFTIFSYTKRIILVNVM